MRALSYTFMSHFRIRKLLSGIILFLTVAARGQTTQPAAVDDKAAKLAAIEARIGVVNRLLRDASAEDYRIFADELQSNGRFDEATIYYLVSEKMKPGNAQCRYQLACTLAQWGQKELAITWLEKASEAGFWGAPALESDGELNSIRQDAKFAGILAAVKKRYDAEAQKHVPRPILAVPAGKAPEGGFPIVLLLHGFGTSNENFRDFADLAAANGLAGIAPSGEVALDEGRFSWGKDAEVTHKYLQSVLDSFRGRMDLNFTRVYLGGFSQGAMHSGVLLATKPDSYRGALCISPGGLSGVPQIVVPARKRPLFLVGGHAENPRTLANLAKFESTWKAAGQPTQVHWHDLGHTFPPDWKDVFGKALHWMVENSEK